VSPEQLESIFDPFFTTKPEGTGLGLSIAHQLIENHNGTIEADVNASGGMTFQISLPIN
jgi:signal transduction histidine kinase